MLIGEQREEARKDLLAIAGMMAAITLFFLPVLLPGKIYFYRDVLFAFYPLSALVKECFDTRVLPLWDPYIGFGQPFLASPDAQIVYPTTLLRIFLPGPLAFKWHVILHTWWGAAGMFLLCRRFRLSRAAALLGGLGFVFAGPFVSYMNFAIHVASAAWMPWVFLALDRALSSWSARRCLIFGGALALQFLAGEAVTCMQTITLGFLYAAVIFGNWRKLRAQENYRILTTFFIAGIFSMLLSAVYLLPFLRYVSLGRRSAGLTSLEANDQSFHPLLIFDLIVPKLFMFDPYSVADWNPWMKALSSNYTPYFFCAYLGTAQCGLALFGAVWGGERRRRFFAVVAVVAILLALGRYAHLFDLFRWTVPIFRTMRFPVKFLLVTSFAVSLLAAYGLEQLRQPVADTYAAAIRRRGMLLVLVLLVLFLLPALYFSVLPAEAYQTVKALAALVGIQNVTLAADQLSPIVRRCFLRSLIVLIVPLLAAKAVGRHMRITALVTGAILIFTVLELALINYGANPVTSDRVTSFRPELLNYFPSPRADYRVIYPNESNSGEIDIPQLIPSRESGGETSLFYIRSLMFPYDTITYQVYTGIDGNKEELYPYEYEDLDEFLYRRDKSNDELTRLLKRTNTRFIVTQRELRLPGLRYVGTAFNFSTEPTRVYEIEDYLPQTFVATRQSYLPAGRATLERLASAQFPDRQEVILNDTAAPHLETDSAATAPTEATSQIVARTLRSFVVEAQLGSPGYLVALHSCMPGWRVTVDGKPAKFYRADQLFMAVPLGPGNHRVEFSYLPTESLLGLVISLLAATGGIGWIVWSRSINITTKLTKKHEEDLISS